MSEAKKEGKEVIVSFMIDGISIKKGLQFLPNRKVRGYVNICTEIDDSDTMQLAKDAVVFTWLWIWMVGGNFLLVKSS